VLHKSLYDFSGKKALIHIFRVASSLDSMIVGEPQILGQMKDAFEFALKRKSTSVLLNRLMKKAISVAKRIRTETKIGANAVSISFAAVELAKKIFEDLSSKSFMLIGAGEMAELAARHLIDNGVKDVLVTNRTYERAEELAREFHGKPVGFDSLLNELEHTDIVICSTGAPDYVIMKNDMHKILKQRKNKPVFIIDISVPRNIDPQINDLDNIYLYDIDDLQGVVNINIEGRNKEAEKAEHIVDEEVEAFLKWHASLSAVPTIIALREKAESIKSEELQKTLLKLSGLGESDLKLIEGLTNSIVNKLVHFPTSVLKSDIEDKEIIIEIVNRMFDLNLHPDNDKNNQSSQGETSGESEKE
jgi:glutamyl-tRNA reductase